MYVPRDQRDNVERLLRPGKVVVLYGTRQVGKTTLVKKPLEESGETHLYVTGEDVFVREYLGACSLPRLCEFVGSRRLVVVDEAQHIPQIGLNLKMLVDAVPDARVRATGSSSLQLAGDTGQPLAGRRFTLRLFPLSCSEISLLDAAQKTTAGGLGGRLSRRRLRSGPQGQLPPLRVIGRPGFLPWTGCLNGLANLVIDWGLLAKLNGLPGHQRRQ